ncbi:MAG: hypothetical protein HY077_06010 [Elusimicrobia bacterium]|nr:hypothetical protein [Elusimicrobiota bacterium]
MNSHRALLFSLCAFAFPAGASAVDMAGPGAAGRPWALPFRMAAPETISMAQKSLAGTDLSARFPAIASIKDLDPKSEEARMVMGAIEPHLLSGAGLEAAYQAGAKDYAAAMDARALEIAAEVSSGKMDAAGLEAAAAGLRAASRRFALYGPADSKPVAAVHEMAEAARSGRTMGAAQALALQVLAGQASAGSDAVVADGLSSAQRLSLTLGKMDPARRQALLGELGKIERLSPVVRAVRDRDEKALPTGLQGLLGKDPATDLFLLNLVEFGDSFPGIFKLGNADQTVMAVLDAVEKQEKLATLSNPDLLKGEGMTYRLSRSIDEAIIGIITQARDEYIPMRFNRTGWQTFWHGVKMWFLPLHNRVEFLVDRGQFFQRQLERYRLIDSLIVRLALGDAIPLKLTNPEVADLANTVLKSPAKVGEIEKDLQGLYHKDFSARSIVPVGGFDIYQMYKNARKFDYDATVRGFDDSDLEALKKLDAVLERASDRRGEAHRTLKDDDKMELRLYFEAYERGVARYSSDYFGTTGQTANEHYTVERRHTRQVPDGRDDKGNQKYRTETYYTDDTVHPSFENILSGSYDTGDRSVSGLEGVKQRASAMAAAERPYRAMMEENEALFQQTLEGYTDLVTAGTTKGKGKKHKGARTVDQVKADMQAAIDQLAQAAAKFAPYAASGDAAILGQYGRDSVQNFRARNGFLLDRLKNMKSLLATLSELLRRQELELRPTFDIWNFHDWLYSLRHLRNRNYGIKTAMAVAAAGAVGAYFLVPEFQAMADGWFQSFLQLFR